MLLVSEFFPHYSEKNKIKRENKTLYFRHVESKIVSKINGLTKYYVK